MSLFKPFPFLTVNQETLLPKAFLSVIMAGWIHGGVYLLSEEKEDLVEDMFFNAKQNTINEIIPLLQKKPLPQEKLVAIFSSFTEKYLDTEKITSIVENNRKGITCEKTLASLLLKIIKVTPFEVEKEVASRLFIQELEEEGLFFSLSMLSDCIMIRPSSVSLLSKSMDEIKDEGKLNAYKNFYDIYEEDATAAVIGISLFSIGFAVNSAILWNVLCYTQNYALPVENAAIIYNEYFHQRDEQIIEEVNNLPDGIVNEQPPGGFMDLVEYLLT